MLNLTIETVPIDYAESEELNYRFRVMDVPNTSSIL